MRLVWNCHIIYDYVWWTFAFFFPGPSQFTAIPRVKWKNRSVFDAYWKSIQSSFHHEKWFMRDYIAECIWYVLDIVIVPNMVILTTNCQWQRETDFPVLSFSDLYVRYQMKIHTEKSMRETLLLLLRKHTFFLIADSLIPWTMKIYRCLLQASFSFLQDF